MSNEQSMSFDFSLFFSINTAPEFRLALQEASGEELAELYDWLSEDEERIPIHYDRLSEDEQQLFIRGDARQKNMLLAKAVRLTKIMEPERLQIFIDGLLISYGSTTSELRLALREASDGQLAEAMKDPEINGHPNLVQKIQAEIVRRADVRRAELLMKQQAELRGKKYEEEVEEKSRQILRDELQRRIREGSERNDAGKRAI